MGISVGLGVFCLRLRLVQRVWRGSEIVEDSINMQFKGDV